MSILHTPRVALIAAAGLVMVACDPASDSGELFAPDFAVAENGLSADRCENFSFSTMGDLGIHLVPGDESEAWYGKLGAQPTSVTIAGMNGTMFSWVDEFWYSGAPSGNPVRGAEHLILHHRFETDGGTSWFQTDDRAVCSPSGIDGGCLVNDQMRIVEGAGAFEDADGWIKNKGQITFGAGGTPVGGTLGLNLHGRVCGDGL